MKLQGGMVIPVPTFCTFPDFYINELQFPFPAPFLLCLIGLKIEVVVGIFA